MTLYLFFTWAAPMASFGAIAVGERRPSWDRPSKSQVIGLVAGCLGIRRDEEAEQRKLADSLGYAVRIDARGRLASDYQTAQTPKDPSLKRRIKRLGPIGSRRDELDCDDVKTVLSQRDFLTDGLYTIALWSAVKYDLETIKDALDEPQFAPFAGRKAYPFMLPFAPYLVKEADHLADAFARYDLAEEVEPEKEEEQGKCRKRNRKMIKAFRENLFPQSKTPRPIYADACALPQDGGGAHRLEQRRDQPQSRAKWRFDLRQEGMFTEKRQEKDCVKPAEAAP